MHFLSFMIYHIIMKLQLVILVYVPVLVICCMVVNTQVMVVDLVYYSSRFVLYGSKYDLGSI